MPTSILPLQIRWQYGLMGLLCTGLFLGSAAPALFAADPPVPENPFPNRVPAVELEGGVEWLNTSGPISLKDLRGKVVLLDFWTFCCINCIHVLPDLKFLEEKYGKELVVIGVHSAKFDNEKETGNIRKAILRYEIAHPVVNDAEMVLWRKFGVRSWPTLVLIDPEGNYCGFISGEGNREVLDKVIGRVIAYHKAKGTLDETPVHFDLERGKQAATPLRFPGKILADSASNRLFISDSNHNRIVVTDLKGELQDVIGSGAIGKADGAYDVAEFDHPQGMALVDDKLYVADTENHMLRVVDLTAKTVTTLAGTGEQGHARAGSFPLRAVALNSPWDLLHLDGVLYIAMAGPHQLWSHKLGQDAIQPYAGSGREDILNGPLAESALAQPSGLATDGHFLYVCDSEGSSIRKVSTHPDNKLLSPGGTVTTVVGSSDLPGGRCLFEFGDIDAIGAKARLQHPLGIVFHDKKLYVADSYNHKVKEINLANAASTTWFAAAPPNSGLEQPKLNEPAGVAIANRTLYIADTNNHRILAVDLQSKLTKELKIAGLQPPTPKQTPGESSGTKSVKVPLQQVAPSADGVSFAVELKLPTGYKLNPQAAVTYQFAAEGDQALFAADDLNVRDEAMTDGTTARFKLSTAATSGTTTLQLSVVYTYCRDGASGLCKLGTASWTIPVEIAAAGSKEIQLQAGGE